MLKDTVFLRSAPGGNISLMVTLLAFLINDDHFHMLPLSNCF